MEVAFNFSPLVAAKLIVYTFGALIHLFLMVLVVGQRRLRRLEWSLFALMAALFMWNSGNLLALNVGLHFGAGPDFLAGAARLIPFIGLMLIPPLLVDVQELYAGQFRPSTLGLRAVKAAFYLPWAAIPWFIGLLLGSAGVDPMLAIRPVAQPLVGWVAGALVVGTIFSFRMARFTRGGPHARFLNGMASLQLILAAGLTWAYLINPLPALGLGGAFPTLLMLIAVLPGIWVAYSIFRHNFLELRVQRNLVYSLVTIFALLIYLAGIRQLGTFLEAYDILPSVVTESVMLFILVVLLEPVKKLINRALHTAFVSEFERVQKLADEIQNFATRSGDMDALKKFVEERVPAELSLEKVSLQKGSAHMSVQRPEEPGKVRALPIRRGEKVIGVLAVTPITSDLSGDQMGALQMLADQLAAALELCQLIAEKVQLERALAEKAKMAFLGEMAARIAHNVKNPLSSMKTLVQLLEEDSSLPERVRKDCQLITHEIDRLNSNISQVLRYAKPARDTDRPADLQAVVNRVVALMRPEAERRGVSLEVDCHDRKALVEGGEEAASDIVSNLVVNALEASSSGGTIRVRLANQRISGGGAELIVEDDGPGIPGDVKDKIFQPFFTTRAAGTGLGLAIVARRAEEIGGTADCSSPITGQGGTRFVVRFRSAHDTSTATELAGKDGSPPRR